MNGTILSDVKNYIGLNPEEIDPDYDKPIMDAINVAIGELAKIGLGHLGDFMVQSGQETWDAYLGEEYQYVRAFAVDYVELTAKLKFDTPQNGALKSALDEQLRKASDNVQTAIEYHNLMKEG